MNAVEKKIWSEHPQRTFRGIVRDLVTLSNIMDDVTEEPLAPEVQVRFLIIGDAPEYLSRLFGMVP